MNEIIPFTTREAWLAERAKDITSTDVAALFGISPYLTRFELWHRKVRCDIEPDDIGDVERVKWGTRLQRAIAEGAAEERGWSIRAADEYIRAPNDRIGASFDYFIGDSDGTTVAILECKNVDGLAFRDGWVETDFGLEAPAHIELQVQHQMLVSGIPRTYIAALVGGNRLVILERDYDPLVGRRILDECATFWHGGEPEPDFRRDAELISRLYRTATEGNAIDADERMARLMAEFNEYSRVAAVAMDEAEARKAELLTLIGDASRVASPTHTLSRWEVPAKEISYTRKPYCGFRITAKKDARK